MSNRSKKVTVVEEKPTFVQSCLSKWSKGVQKGSKWDKESFEDFPVCVYWFRQIMSVTVGIGLGVLGMTGAPGLVGGFGFVTGLTYMYYSGFIEADEFSYGDSGLKTEGLMPSFAGFLLSWTVAFTAMDHALPVAT